MRRAQRAKGWPVGAGVVPNVVSVRLATLRHSCNFAERSLEHRDLAAHDGSLNRITLLDITLLDKVSVAPIIRENASVGIFFLLCTRRIFLPVMCW